MKVQFVLSSDDSKRHFANLDYVPSVGESVTIQGWPAGAEQEDYVVQDVAHVIGRDDNERPMHSLTVTLGID